MEKLEHVCEILGAGESEACVNVARDRVVHNLLTQHILKDRSYLVAGESRRLDAHLLADQRLVLEDFCPELADVLHSVDAHLAVGDGEGDALGPITMRLGAHDDEVFVVKGREELLQRAFHSSNVMHLLLAAPA
jgi:hypothetical protein